MCYYQGMSKAFASHTFSQTFDANQKTQCYCPRMPVSSCVFYSPFIGVHDAFIYQWMVCSYCPKLTLIFDGSQSTDCVGDEFGQSKWKELEPIQKIKLLKFSSNLQGSGVNNGLKRSTRNRRRKLTWFGKCYIDVVESNNPHVLISWSTCQDWWNKYDNEHEWLKNIYENYMQTKNKMT